ncbi:hypothetical protein LWI28_006116 [Acer negundo]|uniref:RRM domain-containing protein n=1 Tax=Acer negundo TaxID=4023 RepID=A0AAD5JI20_ACENE|nr:hypothetical protein LWI28_006116 [Acer negundo]
MQQQQQALMQQALLQQQSLYHPGLLAAPQIEPIPSGNLPPGFDPITCRSVSAAMAILSLNGRHLFGQPIKVNWDYASGQREDMSGQFNILRLLMLLCMRASLFIQVVQMQGLCGIRRLGVLEGAVNEDKPNSDAKSVVELTNGSSEDAKETTNNEAPENNPQYTTVYVGNLAPEVRVQRDKGFGFVRFSTHAEAALAIQMGNNQSYLYGKQIKCSSVSKPTPPGTSSNPLPPP